MFFLLLLYSVAAHTVYNDVHYPILLTNEKQCNEFLPPGHNMEIDVDPGEVVKVKNDLGLFLGSFFIYDGTHNDTFINNAFMKSQHDCKDRVDNRCDINNCRTGKGWMMVMCPKTCHSCHLQKKEVRCNETQLGISNFTAMTTNFRSTTTNYILNNFQHLKPTLLQEESQIIHFDNLLEHHHLIELTEYAKNVQLHRSTGQGSVDGSGVQSMDLISGRTSTNAWCSYNCEQLNSMKNLRRTISEMLQVPERQFEAAQFLRYEEGQLYNQHSDVGFEDFMYLQGPRIFTMFVYLNDVAEGGETEFPRLNVKVKPTAGSAILWSSVKEVDGIFSRDDLMDHRANPPGKNQEKYAMNIWVHSKDFYTPNTWGCSGAFG